MGTTETDNHPLNRRPLNRRPSSLRRLHRLQPAALGLGTALAAQQLLFPAPLGVLLQGAVLGGLTALIAFGIVLVHRGERIVNFAAGDLGGLPAAAAVLCLLSPEFPYVVALAVGLVVAGVVGFAVHGLVIRRFARAPRLVLTLATIFLAQVLAAGEVVLPRLFDVNGVPQAFPPPIDASFAIGGVRFSGNEVVAMVAVPAVLVTLTLFLRRTRLGLAVRASAESSERAATLGVAVPRVRAAVWVLAAVLSALAVFLRAGVVGLPVGRVLGPAILLRALAAAVVGRMEHLGVVVAAAVGLGMLESAVLWDTGRPALVTPVLFVVILGALLLQRRRETPESAADPTWSSGTGAAPDRPAVGRARVLRYRGPAAAFAAAAALPAVLPESRLNLVGLVAIYAVVAVSLVVLTGWAGQVSLGHMAFVGIGAAVAGAATAERGYDLVVAVPLAGVVGAAAAVLIGIPALRLPGLLFAVTTLALAMATSSWLLNPEFMGWLPRGRVPRPPLLGRIDIGSETRFYYVCLTALAAALAGAANLRRSRTGRVLIGVRDNERAAAAYGVSPARAKLFAFAFSGFTAAAAGALHVHHQQALGIVAYQPEESLRAFAMVVLGGLGSLPGAVAGAAWVSGLDHFRGDLPVEVAPFVALLATGLGGLVVLSVAPGGLGGLWSAARQRLRGAR